MKYPHLFAAHADEAEDRPHLPGFRTWRAVYWVVLGCFIAYVVALTVFTQFFA